MTTPARPGAFTGATDNAASGGLFTDTLIDGIPDIIGVDVTRAETAATDAEASATTATTQAASATTSAATATTGATSATADAASALASKLSATASETSATASKTSATASQTAASASQTASASSQSAAASSATSAGSSNTSAAGHSNSALSSASSAATSASTATTKATSATASAATATTQATSATTQAAAALVSKNAAAASETAALASENAAAASETAAGTSETNAAASKTAAETAETNAETAETNAETAETNASTSASAASTSASASLASKNAAAVSEAAALVSKNAAAASETAAGTSETNASTSATAASASQTAAASSATTATQQATISTTKAGESAASSTSAASSQTASSSSASAASSSQSAAATSATNAASSLTTFQGLFVASSSAPASPDVGDLWYDTTNSELKVYVAGSPASWQIAGAYLQGLIANHTFTCTAGQTVFTTDDASGTMSIVVAANVFAYLNGIKLIGGGTDYTISGNTITLASGAIVSDVLYVDILTKISTTQETALNALVTQATAAKTAAELAETNAETAETNAETAETNAETAETNAAASAATASTKATATTADAVATAADKVSTNADVVLTAADVVSAEADRVSCASDRAAITTIYDTFDDRYLGTKTSDPTVDNDGNALLIGAMYFNSTVNNTRFYNGSSWEDPEATATQGAATATTKASEASTSATNAASSATTATTQATNSSNSATSSAGSLTSFNGIYRGQSATAPSSPATGQLWYDTTNTAMKVYTGSAWTAAYVSGTGFLATTGGALTGAVTTTSTFDGRDVAADGVTADAALPKAGGTMTGALDFGDSVKANFGASDDLQIYHNGSNSVIRDTGTGNLEIHAANLRIKNPAQTKSYLNGDDGGAITIFHDGNQKLATTATGIDVTGTVTADGLTVDGNVGIGVVPNSSWNSSWTALQLGATGFVGQYQAGATDITALGSNVWSDGAYKYIETDQAAIIKLQNGTMIFDVAPSGTANNAISFTTAMTINNSGNVGIGTTSPFSKLHVGSRGTASALTYSSAGDGIVFDFYNVGNPYTRYSNIVSSSSDTSESRLGLWTQAASGTSSEKLTILGNGNVGIGTSSPAAGLDIQTSTNVVGLNIRGGGSGGVDCFNVTHGTGTNGDYFTILNTGNVGIGTTSPAQKLDVAGNIAVTGTVIAGNGTAALPSHAFASDPNTGMFRPNSDNLGFSTGGVQRAFMSASQFNVATKVVATELDINGNADVSGNITVGGTVDGRDVATDGTKLDTLSASAIAANTAKTGITSGQASAITANTAKTGITSGQASAITANTAKVGISTAQVSKLNAIEASADVTDATNVSAAGALMKSGGAMTGVLSTKVGTSTVHVSGANDSSLSVRGDSTYPASMSFHRAGAYAVNFGLSTANKMELGGWSASTIKHTWDFSGNYTATGNITAYSDERVKENIEVIPEALNKVKQLSGYTFDRTDFVPDAETGVMPETRQTGVIAQEVIKVLPEAVMTMDDGKYAVAYGNMVGLLIEAIKEQQVQIDELKATIESKGVTS